MSDRRATTTATVYLGEEARLAREFGGDMARLAKQREKEIAALQKRVTELKGVLGDLLRCTEKHVFGDECKAQRDKARAALTGGKDE